jgi:hypothetical protein
MNQKRHFAMAAWAMAALAIGNQCPATISRFSNLPDCHDNYPPKHD